MYCDFINEGGEQGEEAGNSSLNNDHVNVFYSENEGYLAK